MAIQDPLTEQIIGAAGPFRLADWLVRSKIKSGVKHPIDL